MDEKDCDGGVKDTCEKDNYEDIRMNIESEEGATDTCKEDSYEKG